MSRGLQRQQGRSRMESYLEENLGAVKGKNSAEGALRRWRKLSSVVRNPKRRFRFTANLGKRGEAQAIKHANHEKLRVAVLVSKAALDYIKGLTPEEVKATWFQICTDELGSIFQCRTGSNPHHISLQRLKDITDNFNENLILGSGGFGMVYKGVVQEGRIVAVKKLVVSTPKSHNQFENEVDLLMKLEHPNIVRLVGHCYDTQLLHMPFEGKMVVAESTARFLCLECMPNGSLDKYISDASSGLDWRQRSRIIEGISFGLKYLHEEVNGPIIHLDLKPANILLGENLIPKITDFGLSRLFGQLSMHTAVASGTLGYMAVEYQQRGIITPMADIFSLGVIILEVITGHRDYPYDIRTDSKEFIKRELQKWKNRLQKEPVYASLETDCQQIERYIQIGLICVNPERRKRPTMNKIIDMLQGLESLNPYITNEGSGSPFVLLPRSVSVRILATQAFNLFGIRSCFWLVCVCAPVCVSNI